MNDQLQNSMDWTPATALQDCMRECVSDNPPDKILVIALWDEKKYDTRFWNVGMKVSEMVALLEIQKATFFRLMERNEI